MQDHRIRAEVLVIGSGISGCISALTIAEKGIEVTLLTQGEDLFTGNTRLAQGGIVYTGPEDCPKALESDIRTAGWDYNNKKAVRAMAKNGPEVLKRLFLDKYPVPFHKDDDGEYSLTREGGHAVPRILYCADHTGQSIMEVLAKNVAEHPYIRVCTNRTAIDLLTNHHHARGTEFMYTLSNKCLGAYVYNESRNVVETVLADFTVLATGGLGQIYQHTTNSTGSIGSGIAMANRAKARVINAEMVQFHPTTYFQGTRSRASRRFLISEAVRGEGAKLINSSGEAFMHHYDPRADLAPRDIVTRSILDEMFKTEEECVYLDAANHVKHDLTKRFPTIYGKCADAGLDITKEPIPVVPAAHYFCGGILVDEKGKTTLDRLYSVGECSCTGVHGGNRLASTSLLEGMLWGNTAGEDIAARASKKSKINRKMLDAIPDWESPGNNSNEDPALIAQDWAFIRSIMWNYVGITRSTARLNRAIDDLVNLNRNLRSFYKRTPISRPIIDLFHGSQSALTVTVAALRSKKSIGCHYRID
ncbi:L-aspartate oxidase [Maridesulfovibrio hydrothermalis]|uniref:L-aspartate oxidase n=1 Tax=Maridesulfovibrio hydrothermalis AM13 = DSM 14728 TaxID=1121451 RepID=L0RG59_9BACT|nr:L-aspartate oxidase [Maridesulfovibrio hydrothermalis]CCO24546.1 L-aspartate oxidase [Maridesulfovibrio hydrothermalis AM13 = DSM 14728]